MEQQIQRAIRILKEGGIVAFPTDTVYGLGANAFDEDAVLKVYIAKARPRNFALTLLLADTSQIKLVAQDVPKIAWKLVQHFMPGGLTLVLNKSLAVSNMITGEGNTVAVRIPNHPVPIALVRGLGSPITGTSANISGEPSPVNAEEAYKQLRRRVDMIIDGGQCAGGVASTVLDITTDPPTLIREGAIKLEDLSRVCRCHIAVSPPTPGALASPLSTNWTPNPIPGLNEIASIWKPRYGKTSPINLRSKLQSILEKFS
ncbi:MAG: L-threonylcarbamoyladenylate synthase [Chloroflexota bacterium]|nr:L-threonylcarbamoyladenylate synthase [Chloroflexota bacterium]